MELQVHIVEIAEGTERVVNGPFTAFATDRGIMVKEPIVGDTEFVRQSDGTMTDDCYYLAEFGDPTGDTTITILADDAALIAWAVANDIACDDGTPTVDEIVAAINDPDSDSEIVQCNGTWAIIDS